LLSVTPPSPPSLSTLSLHDALPISTVLRTEDVAAEDPVRCEAEQCGRERRERHQHEDARDEGVPREDRHAEHRHAGCAEREDRGDRKSTRLNSSHVSISYAVFCLKK